MTTVSNINTGSTAALSAAVAENQSMANDIQDRFLTLLITQLKNQDPLNPMENAEITSQMAQLSTVNGINQLNSTLLALSGQMDLSQSMQAASLIGRNVLVPGDKIAVGGGQATPFGVDVVSPAAGVKVSIVDGSGQVVREYDLGPQSVGVVDLTWDGLAGNGAAAPDGAYYARVSAVDDSGANVAAGTLTYGRVNSVAYAADGMKLDLGLAGNIGLYDIRKIL